MKAIFVPTKPAFNSDRLTAPLGRLPAGMTGKLREVTDQVAAATVGTPVLEGESLDAIAAANNITRFVPPQPVPQSVEMWRLRVVAEQAGLKDQIEATILELPAEQKVIVSGVWNYGNVAERKNPTILALAQALGLTSAQLDNFFRQAAALPV